MRLSRLQKTLWLAAALAAVGYGGLVLSRPLPSSETVAEGTLRPSFALSDPAGRQVESEDFRGRFLLVFFGFTSCPDVCPTTLAEVATVMDDLGPDAGKIQPLFISVEPERDAGPDLAAFTAAFHPSILGLTGDAAATRAAADSFKIFYAREAIPVAPDGYTMAHSSALFLIGPDGDWLRQYDYGTPAANILADLRSLSEVPA
jgi:protein SCO1/2